MTLEPSVAWQFAHEATTRSAKLERFVENAFARMTPTKPEFARLANLYHPIGLLRLADRRPDEAIAAWRTGLWFRRAQLLLSADPPPDSVPLTVPGADVDVDFVGHGKPWLRSVWLRSLFKAEALGESATVTALLEFENFTELYEDFPSLQIPRQALHGALYSGSDRTAALLAEAVSSIDPAGMPSDRAAFATGRLVTEYELAEAILQGDQDRFDSAVVAAHNAHVAWFSGVGEDDSPRNLDRNVLVNWPLSGLVALGQRRGMAPPPQSPYVVSASLDSGAQIVVDDSSVGAAGLAPLQSPYLVSASMDSDAQIAVDPSFDGATNVTRDVLTDEATFRLAAAYCEPVVATHFAGSTLENCALVEAPHRDTFAKVFRMVGADGSAPVVVAEAMGFSAEVEGPPVMRNVDGVMCEMGTTDYFIEILASMAERGELAVVRMIEEAARAGHLEYVLVEVTNLDDQARIETAITPFIVNQATIGNLTWD